MLIWGNGRGELSLPAERLALSVTVNRDTSPGGRGFKAVDLPLCFSYADTKHMRSDPPDAYGASPLYEKEPLNQVYLRGVCMGGRNTYKGRGIKYSAQIAGGVFEYEFCSGST